MEVQKIKVIKEVEEEMFCFTREEAGLVERILLMFDVELFSGNTFSDSEERVLDKLWDSLNPYFPA